MFSNTSGNLGVFPPLPPLGFLPFRGGGKGDLGFLLLISSNLTLILPSHLPACSYSYTDLPEFCLLWSHPRVMDRVCGP